jgi:16S rRNA (cytosine1402-N4)-methyltransferase
MLDPFDHLPVLLAEVLDLSRAGPGSTIADLTLGAGGHARALLERTAPDGRLIGFDRDCRTLEATAAKLAAFGERVTVVCDNYSRAPEHLRSLGATALDAILLDAGVSSMQLDDPMRGFSCREDGPLDMRMDTRLAVTAADIVARAPVGELERIFSELGEEPQARAVARKIVDVRRRAPITRTRELSELVRSVVPGGGRIHPATRAFQGLRIAVNAELDALDAAIPEAISCLRPGGRFIVITFHSLEEKIVKNRFREAEAAGLVRLVNDAPILPSAEEVQRNPRSRSAKLRCAERL